MKTKDLTGFRDNLLDWQALSAKFGVLMPTDEGVFAALEAKSKQETGSADYANSADSILLRCAYCLRPTADCLRLTTFDQSFVGRRVVHVDENAGIGDFHELRRVAVFTDDRVGGVFGGERQQLRKQFLADNDGVATLAFVGWNKDRRVGGFEMLYSLTMTPVEMAG